MGQQLNKPLLQRLVKGNLLGLLNYIKSDNDLRFEVRKDGTAVIYYRKGKALKISNSKFSADGQYVKNTNFTMPNVNLAGNNPAQYFTDMKKIIDNWVDNIKKRPEFDTQQNIAKNNQDINDRYIIIDMEYGFSQSKIPQGNRIKKRPIFDLLGLERKTGNIVFFEVKKGLSALKGNSGIRSHIEDFEDFLFEKQFQKNLEDDIKNIISDKRELGLITNYDLPSNFQINDNNIGFIFVFEPVNQNDTKDYQNIYNKQTNGLSKDYRTIFVSKNDYKLR